MSQDKGHLYGGDGIFNCEYFHIGNEAAEKTYINIENRELEIHELKAPINDNDAATKKYVDDNAGGGGADRALDNLAIPIEWNKLVDWTNYNDIAVYWEGQKEFIEICFGESGWANIVKLNGLCSWPDLDLSFVPTSLQAAAENVLLVVDTEGYIYLTTNLASWSSIIDNGLSPIYLVYNPADDKYTLGSYQRMYRANANDLEEWDSMNLPEFPHEDYEIKGLTVIGRAVTAVYCDSASGEGLPVILTENNDTGDIEEVEISSSLTSGWGEAWLMSNSDGAILIFPNNKTAYKSVDGLTWTEITAFAPETVLTTYAYDGNRILCCSQTETYISLDNGVSWAAAEFPVNPKLISGGGGVFLAVTEDEQNGYTWMTKTPKAYNAMLPVFTQILAGQNNGAGVGNGGYRLISIPYTSDGANLDVPSIAAQVINAFNDKVLPVLFDGTYWFVLWNVGCTGGSMDGVNSFQFVYQYYDQTYTNITYKVISFLYYGSSWTVSVDEFTVATT